MIVSKFVRNENDTNRQRIVMRERRGKEREPEQRIEIVSQREKRTRKEIKR